MEWLYVLLSQLSSPHLKVISLQWAREVDVDAADWGRIERILTGPHWANLEKFKIILLYDGLRQLRTRLIKRRLPLLADRIVVQFPGQNPNHRTG